MKIIDYKKRSIPILIWICLNAWNCLADNTCFRDNTVSDFSQGTVGSSTTITTMLDGEITLKPLMSESFSGSSTPSGWSNAIWDGQGGASTTYSSGNVIVDGSHAYTNTTFSPGSTAEFSATFTQGNYQNIGFTGDADFNNPWIVIGRGGAGDNDVYVRTSDGQSVSLGSNLLNAMHVYKIKWNAGTNNFQFYVDGNLASTSSITITASSNLYFQISDYPAGGVALTVDYVKITPYVSSGTFISRIYDAGVAKQWDDVSWLSDVPSGTTLSVSVRTGDTPAPDGTWTSYTSVNSGNNLNATSRYIQYKAILTTSNGNNTPVLKDIGFDCEDAGDLAPSVTTHPASQTICAGVLAVFVSKATGRPTPTVQWQVNTDGGNIWINVGVTSDTLQFISSSTQNGYRYRAVWTNLAGSINSGAATLTVNALPTATIAALNTNLCSGDSIRLQLAAATGQSPYTIVVDGTTYTNVTVGQVFKTIDPLPTQSIWGSGGSPASPSVSDGVPIETGTKFRSNVSGYIKGIRFYKGSTNTGTHVGSLWTTSGTLLATATFTNESASGWQEVTFSTPVAISANTTYIASYFSQGGYFAISAGFFTNSGVTNGSLTALQSGVDGPNGVYKYGGGFPDGGNTANYWVDVLFSQAILPFTSTYQLTSVTDGNCSNTGSPLSSTTVTVHGPPVGTISSGTFCAGDSIKLTFNATTGTSPFSLVVNGNIYNNITSGVPFFVDTAAITQPTTIWSSGVVGGSPGSPDPSDLEIGVKFRSAVAGQITGVRFYKLSGNTGTHTGTLWSSSGTMLATATFTNETATGWQQVNFSTPVTIAANTTYVASYHAPNGDYAFDANYFTNAGVTNGTLTALQTGVDGSNGVYKYGSGTLFPNESYNNANYWVDVMFAGSSNKSYSLTNIVDTYGCTKSGSPLSSTVATIINGANNSSSTSVSACSSYSWNGTTYTTSGTYKFHSTNITGCDSTAILILTLTKPDVSSAAAVVENFCGNNNKPYANLSANNPSPSTGSWTIKSGAGTITNTFNYQTQVINMTSGAATSLQWLVDNNGCKDSIVVNVTPANTLNINAIATGDNCRTCTVHNGNVLSFFDNTGNIIAKIEAAASGVELGSTDACLDLLSYTASSVPTVNTAYGNQPYLPRRWAITPAAMPASSHVTLYFKKAEFDALQQAATGTNFQFSNMSDLQVTKFNGVMTDPPVYPARDTSAVLMATTFKRYPDLANGPDYSAEFDISTYSTFYVHSGAFSFSTLPVELVSFTGRNQDDENKLQWTTASENNTDKFEIQKSATGNDWARIGEQHASGNSTKSITYNFSDGNPFTGNNYYRLKIIDRDAKFSYSNVINISLANAVNSFINIYPNPATDILNVEIQSTTTEYNSKIVVRNILGETVLEKSFTITKGLNKFQMDCTGLSKGAYVIQFSGNSEKINKTKFVKY